MLTCCSPCRACHGRQLDFCSLLRTPCVDGLSGLVRRGPLRGRLLASIALSWLGDPHLRRSASTAEPTQRLRPDPCGPPQAGVKITLVSAGGTVYSVTRATGISMRDELEMACDVPGSHRRRTCLGAGRRGGKDAGRNRWRKPTRTTIICTSASARSTPSIMASRASRPTSFWSTASCWSRTRKSELKPDRTLEALYLDPLRPARQGRRRQRLSRRRSVSPADRHQERRRADLRGRSPRCWPNTPTSSRWSATASSSPRRSTWSSPAIGRPQIMAAQKVRYAGVDGRHERFGFRRAGRT